MDKLVYPLLYYQLKENAYLGILVGTKYQLVAKDVKSLKNTLTSHLKKEYKRYDDYPISDILDPKLKVFEIRVRPSYREESGAYPLSEFIKIPVVAVYGETDNSYYQCELPLLGESFYYYDAKQLPTLVRHFATNFLNQKTPRDLHRFLLNGQPQLETISMRVDYDRDFEWTPRHERQYETLNSLCEKYPYQKVIQKKISVFPDAAWELEDTVIEVTEKIIGTKSNLLVVGNSGVGKSSVLKQAIKKITTRAKKEKLEVSFWRIMPQRIVSTAKYLGDWQENCEKLINELQAVNGVLWIENFIRLLQIGGEGPEDSVAAFLITYLQSGDIQVIGEVCPTELESMRRLLPGFVEYFQVVEVEELPEVKIFNILDKFSEYSSQNLKIDFQKEALDLSYRLLLRYYPYESFPGKAVRFLAQCIDEARYNERQKIEQKDIISTFITNTGMPELFLRDDIILDQDKLKQYFEDRIIGQDTAIEQLCNIVKVFKTGLNNPNKPINTMIFAGPTGVGKTASAKALSEYFFGMSKMKSPLIRIDMSEFQYPGQISQLIGSAREVGKLIKEIRERPFSVLLFDEVEKAHPSIFDALLGMLDEGMIVDHFGRLTNFRNTIIIMTTNLGASNRPAMGFKNTTDDDANYMSAIGKFFRPEFINRIDNIIMFEALEREDIIKIAKKELEDLKLREGFVKNRLTLEFSANVIERIVEVGFDKRYGARPLQRAIENFIIAPLSNWLLANPKIQHQKIYVDYDGTLIVKTK